MEIRGAVYREGLYQLDGTMNTVKQLIKKAEGLRGVGENIQHLLDERRMTQQNLAEALGISKQVVNKIIKGNKAINVKEIAEIAQILGVSADDLLMVRDTNTAPDSLSFMGTVQDEDTLQKINRIREAIDEIHMLEGVLHDK